MVRERRVAVGEHSALELSPDDQRHLDTYRRKLQVVRDRTSAVVNGYSTGFYLWGRPGISKSRTVLDELECLNADYKVSNSHSTARGLVSLLEQYPDTIHVLEDIETLARDQTAVGVLRSALWSNTSRPDGEERRITWITQRKSIDFAFRGGIIFTANCPLGELPQLKALETRMECLKLQPTLPEMKAMMRDIALRGYAQNGQNLMAQDCLAVAEFVIGESRNRKIELNMRLLIQGFRTRLQAENLDAGCSWQDLICSSLEGQATGHGPILPIGVRQQTRQRELAIVREIGSLKRAERRRRWEEATGKSESVYYNRLAELGQIDARGLCPSER